MKGVPVRKKEQPRLLLELSACCRKRLTRGFLLERCQRWAFTARWTASAVAQALHVELEFRDGAAERVPVHAELARGLALVPVVFLENRDDEPLLEFANGFGIQNAALVHLKNECFELILHSASLYKRARRKARAIAISSVEKVPKALSPLPFLKS